MFKEVNYPIKCIVILTAAIISLTLAACSMERSAEETVLYDQTVTQSYPKDNILALTSVRSDTGEQGNRFIIEFDTSSEYVRKQGLETALKIMEETPTSFSWGIEGESAAQVKALEVQVTEKKHSLYVTLLFAPQVESFMKSQMTDCAKLRGQEAQRTEWSWNRNDRYKAEREEKRYGVIKGDAGDIGRSFDSLCG